MLLRLCLVLGCCGMLPGTLFAQTGVEAVSSGNVAVLPEARIIPVEGMVKGFLFTTLKRRTEEAIADGVKLIVYSIKSDGGEIGAALDMSNYVFNLDPGIRTIAYVEDKAYSAAALFALSCDDLMMKPRSTIGDCQPIMMTSEGPQVIGEKIQTVLRERFRTYAEVNGYPTLLAQAMVTQEYEVWSLTDLEKNELVTLQRRDFEFLSEDQQKRYRKEKILSHAGELLTLNDKEAIDLGFSAATHDTPQDLLESLGYQEKIRVDAPSSSEGVIDFFDTYTPLFLMVALFCAYLEFKTPGLGIFGSLAAVSIAAYFIGKFYTGQANYLEILLFALGIGLLALEIFVFPGFGICGITGVVVMLVSLVLSMQSFPVTGPEADMDATLHNLYIVCGSFLAATLAFILLLALFPRLHFVPGLIESDRQPPSPSMGSTDAVSLVGKHGTAICDLRPVGKVRIDGEVHQVVAAHGWVESGCQVRVIEQEGNHILVSQDEAQT